MEIAPIGMGQEIERIDMPDMFVGRDNQYVVEDESVGKGVGVTNADQQDADDQRPAWRNPISY